jgi:hypothetical protein
MTLAPDLWGPSVWAAIHLICLGAPEKIDPATQNAYATFFKQLPYILPCATCAKHLEANLQTLPLEGDVTQTRESLFRWSVELHNLVNKQLGKPMMTLQDARLLWQKGGHTHSDIQTKKTNGLSRLILGIFLGLLAGLVLSHAFTRGRRSL